MLDKKVGEVFANRLFFQNEGTHNQESFTMGRPVSGQEFL
jgi:hypothetical protein